MTEYEKPEEVAAVEAAPEVDEDTHVWEEEEATEPSAEATEEATEPKESAAVVEEPKPERKPASVVRMARNLGISQAKIESLSADALDLLCDSLAEKQETDAATAAAKRKAEEAPEVDEDEAILAELKEELDPKVFKLLEKQNKELKAAKAERESTKKAQQQHQQMQFYNAVDGALASLDSPLLGGKAQGHTLKQGSDEMHRRNIVVQFASTLPQHLSWPDRIKAAAKAILGIVPTEAPSPAESALEEKKKKWKAAGTNPPTARKETGEKGDAAAVKAVGRWMKENGFYDDE